ncbi:MAG: NAD-dependent epimerase/dehydratase family protein [Thiomicrorhabdus chilensis]|uniref:NAD-dependent epimerase/dehydratase family protein n=1 Tax=Thiomicrorhabdus chilensis TaxID=63656 RepID=UPI00299EA78B|nr:NAD-dependent epimerase/dehydratase family protein [Thiomicrorhabdus chilensis]MDX1347437.1 NAD-dependent epimerase/dehydratase family protein [Thiomicrorhabdus chilensis]
MTLLLFGASGFIGRAVLNQLALLEVERIICVRRELTGMEPCPNDKVEWQALDILKPDLSQLNRLIEESDTVINCTGELENAATMTEINLGFVKRLTALLKASTKAHRFIQLSSVGCYGAVHFYRGQAKHITEASAERPAGLYESSKTQADDFIREQIAEQIDEQIDEQTAHLSYTIIRPTNVFGQGMKSQALLSLANMIRARRFFFIGPRTAVSTYIEVNDVARLFALCITRPEASKNQVFIASNDCLQTELVESIAAYHQVSPPSLRLPERPIRALSRLLNRLPIGFPLNQSRIDSLTSQVEFSHEKAEQALGFKPEQPVPVQILSFLEQHSNRRTNETNTIENTPQ